MSEIEKINERIGKAVKAINSCFPTALEAARNLQSCVEQMQRIFPAPETESPPNKITFDEFEDLLLKQIGEAFNMSREALFATVDPVKPQLIQGYTAEQWQEIKEGRYLCEFSGRNESRIEFLHYVGADELFQASDFSEWPKCRPAQIKGVMRPIFVEPADKSSMLCLFDCEGFPLNNRLSRPSWDGYKDGSGDFYAEATKYIEL